MYALTIYLFYMVPMWILALFGNVDRDKFMIVCFASFALLELIRIRTTLEEHNEKS